MGKGRRSVLDTVSAPRMFFSVFTVKMLVLPRRDPPGWVLAFGIKR